MVVFIIEEGRLARGHRAFYAKSGWYPNSFVSLNLNDLRATSETGTDRRPCVYRSGVESVLSGSLNHLDEKSAMGGSASRCQLPRYRLIVGTVD
jgi:hypothetical protein